MLTKIFILSLLLLGAIVSSAIGPSPCPVTNHNGTVFSGNIYYIQELLLLATQE